MVSEKSTATSGVSARVCIKRKSRSWPTLCTTTVRATYSHFLPSLRFFHSRHLFRRPRRPCVFRAPHFQFCVNYFSRGSFSHPLGPLGYAPRANFERPCNARTPRLASDHFRKYFFSRCDTGFSVPTYMASNMWVE